MFWPFHRNLQSKPNHPINIRLIRAVLFQNLKWSGTAYESTMHIRWHNHRCDTGFPVNIINNDLTLCNHILYPFTLNLFSSKMRPTATPIVRFTAIWLVTWLSFHGLCIDISTRNRTETMDFTTEYLIE